MNYIKSLQEKNADLSAQIANANAEISAFLAHLYSGKFQGFEVVDSRLERKDWIATGDVITRLHEIRGGLM